jgi:hypothetical protein
MENDLAQFIAENLFDTNQSAISAIADMIRPILVKWWETAQSSEVEGHAGEGE